MFNFITQDLPSLNLTYDFIKGNAPETWEAKLKPRTKAFYVETLTNPLLEVTDLESVVRFCQEHELIAIIDNTFTTPINFRPPEHGFDISIHSCSKYLNGHSDIVGGAVIGRASLLKKITHKLNHLGGIETLVTRPAATSHAGMSPDELRKAGITETLIRVSTGIESPEDLIADFDQAIST